MSGAFYHADGREVKIGDTVTSSRGEEMTVFAIVPPSGDMIDNSTGRICTAPYSFGFYPSVFGLTWKE